MKYIYKLKHNTPEILKGALLKYDENRGRYKVINLSDVARYELTPSSYFTFHPTIVEESEYWFELID